MGEVASEGRRPILTMTSSASSSAVPAFLALLLLLLPLASVAQAQPTIQGVF